MTVLVVLESIVLALLVALVVGLLRTHAEVLRRLHELGAGIYETDQPRTTQADLDPTDGRAAIVELTPRGQRAYDAYRDATDAIVVETFAGWSAKEVHVLADYLERVAIDVARGPQPGAERGTGARRNGAAAP
jgi:hypothetical protein